MPVTLPPGWARLATRPSWTGVYTFAEDDWDRCCSSFHRERNLRGAYRGDHGYLAADQIGYQRR
jgi:hypothetical protein